MNNKEHLTQKGLHVVVEIKASINLGLTDQLKQAFPSIVSIKKPLIQDQKIFDFYWLAGFTSGEGCFLVSIFKSKTTKTGQAVKLIFQLTQHLRDEQLMKSLIEYFKAGNVIKSREAIDFKITKFEDFIEKVIPFFDKYKIIGVKSQDYQDLKKNRFFNEKR